MREVIGKWYQRNFSDPEVVSFVIVLAVITATILMFGHIFAPVIAAIVFAYLLDAPVIYLERCKCPHWASVLIIYVAFVGIVLYIILGPIPMLWQQMANLFDELPKMLSRGQDLILRLPDRFPDYLSADQLKHFLLELKGQIIGVTQAAVSQTLSTIPSLIALVVYLILVPMMVYFFLMDKQLILNWLGTFMPDQKGLLNRVWHDLHEQIGNYIRGKVVEIVIVWVVFYITFLIMGLPYAMLLSALVGISVLIPYIGAIVVTFPVLIIGFWEWGFTQQFVTLIITYTILITLDGYVLAPLLLSEAVNLHPIAIIIAIMFFGGIWGFWGIFFAIPLASLVKAIINAWPSRNV